MNVPINSYAGRRVLVTGGLGFIGSNLSIELIRLGADVTIVDSMATGCGGNYRNIERVARKVNVIDADIADTARLRHILSGVDTVFNLAGEVSHIHSIVFPERDLKVNTGSQMSFLLQCADQAPGVRVVYAGTRQVYGRPAYLPVDESHPVSPIDFNGIHKQAAEQYHLMFTRAGFLDAVVLRLTNTYGPRLAVNVTCQGVLSIFFQQLLLGKPVEVYGDGTQLRDPLYVDDAVDAILRAGAEKRLKSRIYNVGGCQSLTLGEIAGTMCRAAGVGPPNFRPFPAELAVIDIGSFVSNSNLIRRELGWEPTTLFAEGAAATFGFFRERWGDYLDASGPQPACLLCQPEELKRKASSQ